MNFQVTYLFFTWLRLKSVEQFHFSNGNRDTPCLPNSPMSTKPKIHILGTGGTIANITGNYISAADFVPIDALLDLAPDEVTSHGELSLTEITHLNSGALTPEVWFDLHDEIMQRSSSNNPPDGFVITHGSNTSEETAYFLNLVLKTEIPVIVTAAQRNIGKLGSEGFKNLYDSIRVASSPDSVGKGVLFVANEEIHHARDVTKLAASRPDAWRSPNFGRLGDIFDEVRFYRTSTRASTVKTEFDISDCTTSDFPLLDVQIVYSSFSDDGTMVRAAVDSGAKGIVCAAFPTCSPAWPDNHPTQGDALIEATKKDIPVVLCNRGTSGFKPVKEPFLNGGTLRPQKARILLALALMKTNDPQELQRIFNSY